MEDLKVDATKVSLTTLAVLGLVAISATALHPASAEESYVLTIKDHKFEPAEIEVPAGQEVTILIKNADDTPEEFDSEALNIEKVIGGGQEVSTKIGPLEAGTYDFVGEFNEDTAKGSVIVK